MYIVRLMMVVLVNLPYVHRIDLYAIGDMSFFVILKKNLNLDTVTWKGAIVCEISAKCDWPASQ